ncbi:MAG: MarR family transcriptional regulator [Ignavibacteriae bacterium]|nr:MarR family transcriptional regulator [Ignavibacteriota bacterium]
MEDNSAQTGAGIADLLLKCHQLERELAGSADLSVDEFHCLSQLYLRAPSSAKELCDLLGVHPSRASKLLNDLEKRGYVARALGLSDKRRERITLTSEGVVAARSLLQSSAISARHMAASLPSTSVRLLVSTPASPEEQTPVT